MTGRAWKEIGSKAFDTAQISTPGNAEGLLREARIAQKKITWQEVNRRLDNYLKKTQDRFRRKWPQQLEPEVGCGPLRRLRSQTGIRKMIGLFEPATGIARNWLATSIVQS